MGLTIKFIVPFPQKRYYFIKQDDKFLEDTASSNILIVLPELGANEREEDLIQFLVPHLKGPLTLSAHHLRFVSFIQKDLLWKWQALKIEGS